MDPLSWLGLRKARAGNTNLSVIHELMRELLPDDEPVVLRYIVVVAVLLTRIVHADGRVLAAEIERLQAVFRHIDRMPPDGVDELCQTLNERVPKLTSAEIDLCYAELKALCDASERREVLRLLATQAVADGVIDPAEHGALLEIARELAVPEDEVAGLEQEALRHSQVPPASET